MKRFFIFLLILSLILLPSCRSSGNSKFELHFLDVGQGDSLLIRTSEGDVLVDAGTDASEEFFLARLSRLGVKELKLAVFTHSDSDHIGGADGLLSKIPAEEIWYDQVGSDDAANRLQSVIAEKQYRVSTVRTGDAFSLGGMTLEVLSPQLSCGEEGNDSSIVLRLTYGDFSALLMGDAEDKTEKKLCNIYGENILDCDLIKIGHHGSNTSSSEALLQAVTPEYAVISCGLDNAYGHPHGVILQRLEDCDSTVLRTDLLGEISFFFDGESVTLKK